MKIPNGEQGWEKMSPTSVCGDPVGKKIAIGTGMGT